VTTEESPDDSEPAVELDTVYDAFDAVGRPHLTATELSRKTDLTPDEARVALSELAEAGDIQRQDVAGVESVWYPTDVASVTDRERVILFPDRREVVVEHPEQFTRAQLSQFARLGDANRSGGYVYEIREADIWAAPHESLEDLLATMRDVLGEHSAHLAEWVTSQWERARKFRLYTHEDGYVVLEAESDELMGNVARPKLDDDLLRAPISDAESWVNEDATAEVKRTLYEAGYPVRDDRELATGEPLEVDLRLRLRDYQTDWVERFTEQGSGVFVGPPGSGKTVAAMGAMAAVGGETLILVPSRELSTQWRDELVRHTTLTDDDIGEYHGGEKAIEPVTIATYRTAGMDRHRKLFDQRKWGLVVFDECLSGDTVVETEDGRRTFEELDEAYGFEMGWNPGIDETVLTYDEDRGAYVRDEVTGVYKTTAPVREIHTNLGHALRATPGHTHLVFDPETGELNEQSDISAGEFLVRPEPTAPDRTTRSSSAMTADAVRAELLGWFFGDGHYDRHDWITFSFSRNADEQVGIIADLCSQLGVQYSCFENNRGDLTLVSPDLDTELARLAAIQNGAKSVPAACYNWDAEQRSAILRGLYDAEGAISEQGRIQFDSVSAGLADDVSHLLQKFGIPSRRMHIERDPDAHNDRYRITVSSFYGGRFERAVGFRLRHKRERVTSGASPAQGLPVGKLLQNIKAQTALTNEQLAAMAGVSRQTIGDVIRGSYRLGQRHLATLADGLAAWAERPVEEYESARNGFGVTYETLGAEIGVTAGGACSRLDRRTPTAVEALEARLSERQNRAKKWASTLSYLTNVTVVAVTAVDHGGTETVYDFETESHTFLADGFLTHNCHHIPAPVFRRSVDLQTKHRLGLTATPTRESDDEEEIFTLIGPPIGTDWGTLFDKGYVSEPEVEIRLVPWGEAGERTEYAATSGHDRRQAAAGNSGKIDEIRYTLAESPDVKALVFVEYLDDGRAISEAIDAPFISGETPHAERERLFGEFRRGDQQTLVVSRVGDEGIDLPDAELAIVASGLGGSRRQGAQRAGRTMRPAGDARMVVLATRGTTEEDFVRRQMRHLASKGIRVTEQVAAAVEAPEE